MNTAATTKVYRLQNDDENGLDDVGGEVQLCVTFIIYIEESP